MSANNPFSIYFPADGSLSQLGASMDILIKHISWELGELYDRKLSREPQPLGPGWLGRLGGTRGAAYRLHDPSFVFAEPENHADSVIWHALPARTPELVGQFKRARITRNFWEHQAVDQDLNRFGEGVRRYLALSEAVGLTETVDECRRILDRVNSIRKSGGSRSTTSAEMDRGIEERLVVAEKEVLEARTARDLAVKRQEEQQGAQAHRQAELEQAAAERETALVQALEDLGQLREQLQLVRQETRLNAVEEAEGLVPGEEWRGPLGARLLLLRPRLRDLVDPEQRVLLSDELGPVAKDAALRWLEILPQGGQVHLSTGGHAAIQRGGRFVYLGQLDTSVKEAAEEATPASAIRPRDAEQLRTTPERRTFSRAAPGSLLLHRHEVTADRKDVFQYGTERLLSAVLGAADAESIAEQLAADVDPGELFRISNEGLVLINRGGEYVPVGQVDLDYWFRWGEAS